MISVDMFSIFDYLQEGLFTGRILPMRFGHSGFAVH